MTGAALLRRVLKDPILAMKWHAPQIIPLSSRPVMEAVCTLIAASDPKGIVYRLDPDCDGAETLPAVVALMANAVGAEAEIEAQLQILARMGFLHVYADNSVALAPAMRARAGAGGDTGLKRGGGKPRKGETKEQAAVRRARERADAMAQFSMVMSLPGGEQPFVLQPLSGFALARQLRAGFQLVQGGIVDPSSSEPEFNSDANSNSNSQVDQAPFEFPPTEAIPLAAAAAFSEELTLKAAAAAVSPDLPRDAIAENSTETRNSIPNSNSTANSEPEPVDEMGLASERLAVLATDRFTLRGHHKKEASGHFRRFLSQGYQEADIAAVLKSWQGPVTTAGYFKDELKKRYGMRRAPPVEISPAALDAGGARQPDDPRLAEYPAALSSTTKRFLLAVLDLMDMPQAQAKERAAKLSFQRSLCRDAWDHVLERHPSLRDMTDWEPRRAFG